MVKQKVSNSRSWPLPGGRLEQGESLEKAIEREMLEFGFVDPTNFIRKFKKLEGVTPIQYRTLVQTGPLSFSK